MSNQWLPFGNCPIGPGKWLQSGFGRTDDATATSTLSGGTVYTIPITNPGTGYTSAPTMSFTAAPSGGTNAAATAVLGSGFVVQVPISDAGTGYVDPPAVTFSGGGGAGAAGVGVIGPNGTIVDIQITNPGSGYTSVPTAAIAAAPSGGTNATLGTVVCSFSVASITITNAGAGYLVAPLVTFGPPQLVVVPTAMYVLDAPPRAQVVSDSRTSGAALNVIYPSFGASQPIASGIGIPNAPSGVVVFNRITDTGTVSQAYGVELIGH